MAATCTTTGSETLTCNVCGDVEKDVEIPTIDHNFGDDGMEAYCTYGCGTINLNAVNRLKGYTYSEVQAICQAGNASDYFEVGDTGIITIDALPNAYNKTSAQIATIVVGDMTDTSLTLLVTNYNTSVPSHYMNPTSTNEGGWASTSMRVWLNDEYLKALPSDIQNTITYHSSSYSATYNAEEVSYCDDKVWLLSEKEVFGIQTSENTSTSNIEKQLDYFATTSDNRVRYSSSTSVSWWWLRSSDYNYSHTFTAVDGYGFSCYNGATHSYDVFPAFDIG